MSKIIEYKNIGKSYHGTWVIRNFNLSIHEGDFICIVGTSGSGKTTLLKMINGLLKPDEGEIMILFHLEEKLAMPFKGMGCFLT